MPDLKGIKLNIGLDSVSSVSVISRNTVSYSISCNNAGTQTLNVSCPINQAHRNIDTVYEVVSPYSVLNLDGYATEIDLINNQNYTVSQSILSGPANDVSVAVNTNAQWFLTNNTLDSYTLLSQRIPNYNNLMFPLGPDTCVSISITDTIYQLKFTFNTNVVLTPTNSGDNALQTLDNITTYSVTGDDASASYTDTLEIKVNYIWLNVTSMGIIPCGGIPTPVPVPTLNSVMSRYGIVTDSQTGQNSLGIYYGFNTSQAAQVFDYSNIDKYKLLIKRDDCFKILIVFLLPIPFIPFVIPIPTWVNVEIINKVTQVLTTAVTTAQGTFNAALTVVLEVKDQINVKNAVVLASKGASIVKVVASGEANDILAQAVENLVQKQIDKVIAAKNYATLSNVVDDAKTIIDKGTELVNTLSRMQAVLDMFNGDSNDSSTARGLLEAIKAANDAIDLAFKDFAELVDRAPDNAVKRRAQLIIRDIQTYLNILKDQAKAIAKTLDQTKPVEIIVGVVEVILDVRAIKQLFVIAKDLNLMTLAYDVLVEELDQLGVIKTATELDERASKQQKSEFEAQAEARSQEAASAIDNAIDQVADTIHLKDLENLALQGIKEADKLLTAATDALNNAIDDIAAAKRNNINSLIGTYLVQNLDLYKISTFGSFDNNNPLDKQIVINDIKGTRIYDINGNLLFEKADFCNRPFIEIAGSLNSNGCKTTDNSPIIDTSPCGSYTCQNFGYWYGIGRFKTSFDFYQNHDLSKGGIRVGDFDGDGMDDLWCHYPGSTKNYNGTKANEIIYGPLKSYKTNNRFNYKQQTLPINSWCKDGVVKIGDFNGDQKSDAICITDHDIYLLYSTGESFRPASSDPNGLISIAEIINSKAFSSQNINGWTANANIVVGDFDGDKCSDILKFTSTQIDVLFGSESEIFITKTIEVNAWSISYQSSLVKCNQVGINRILAEDIDNDGKDDIACISSETVIISSPILSPKQILALQSTTTKIRVFVNDLTLQDLSSNQVQYKSNINRETHYNLIKGDALLLSESNTKLGSKTVSEFYMPLQCLAQVHANTTVESYINFKESFFVPEKVLWDGGTNNLAVNIEAYVSMIGSDVVELDSNPIQSFAYILESYKGSCYTSQETTNFVSINVNYNAIATMTIERNGQVLLGNELAGIARDYLTGFVAKESSVTFPIEGHMTVNLLGLGLETTEHCN